MRKHAITLALAGLAMTMGLAACSSGNADPGIASGGAGQSPGAGAASNAPFADPSAKPDWVGYARCMRENGIDMPDPPTPDQKPAFDQSTADPAKYESATDKCRAHVPNLGKQPQPMDAATLEMWRTWAKCMRDNGVNVEDPKPSDARPPALDIPRGSDAALYRNAIKACNDIVGGQISLDGDDAPKGS